MPAQPMLSGRAAFSLAACAQPLAARAAGVALEFLRGPPLPVELAGEPKEPLPPRDDKDKAPHIIEFGVSELVVFVFAFTTFALALACLVKLVMRKERVVLDRPLERSMRQSVANVNVRQIEQRKRLLSMDNEALMKCPVLCTLQGMPEEERVHGDAVKAALRFTTLFDLLPRTSSIIFEDTSTRAPLTHSELYEFVRGLDLAALDLAPGDRLAALVPNGAEAAVLLLACFAKCTIVPLNPTSTQQEIVHDSRRVRAKLLLVAAEYEDDDKQNMIITQATADLGIPIVVLHPDLVTAGKFSFKGWQGAELPHLTSAETALNRRSDHVFVLFTSGTSGNKKCVPYSLDTLLVGATIIVATWELRPSDKVLNMMPLFHIGGIARNVLGPVLSGGGAVLCASFDQVLFWDVYAERNHTVTWYYAGPTMHQALLEEFRTRDIEGPVFRFVANAAGGLLPQLAREMREHFGCTVLPGYGMTECMPISAPPITYQLDREGTSGRRTGPELKIFNDSGEEVPPEVQGNIVVRGAPVFAGYEGDPEATKESFYEGGWFKTGDNGYMDKDGYLYITGRSKEIINRGGEVISPFEIEEAIQSHPSVRAVLAFTAPHAVLQETVGVAIVPLPGKAEVSLRSVRKHCRESLTHAKMPQVLVIMPDLPKNAANKLLRAKFAERMALEKIWSGGMVDSMPEMRRTFRAGCPPKGAPLTEPLPDVQQIELDLAALAERVKKEGAPHGVREAALAWVQGEAWLGACVTPKNADVSGLTGLLCSSWHEWEVPAAIVAVDQLPKNADGTIDVKQLRETLEKEDPNYTGPRNIGEEEVQEVWQQLLNQSKISIDVNFFDAGGSSLLAGTLAAMMGESLHVNFSAADVFNAPTIEEMAILVENRKGVMSFSGHSVLHHVPGMSIVAVNAHQDELYSATSPVLLLIQLLPFLVFQPLRRAVGWTLFLLFYVKVEQWFRVNRFTALILALAMSKLIMSLAIPLLAIGVKWAVVGKYKEGSYPVFGPMYRRWWFVSTVQRLAGRGIFKWNLPAYYRLLGAKIGENVKIAERTSITEYDLVTIGDGVALDNCIVRPFGMVPKSHMTLRAIDIGAHCSVARKTVIAAGAVLPPHTCLGPLSSSHELRDARVEMRDACMLHKKAPPLWIQRLVGQPLLCAQWMFSLLPAIMLIARMTRLSWHQDFAGQHGRHHRTLGIAFAYFSGRQRIMYYFLIRMVHKVVSPFLKFFFAVLVKRCIIGVFEETPQGQEPDCSAWELFRPWLLRELIPDAHLCGVTQLLGRHYDCISWMFRLLGVKVGKKVYWPGSGFLFSEPDLVDIGDYVVFGSRSDFLTSDAEHRRRGIRIEAGGNVSDRCVLMPGTTVRRGAVMGSGSLTKADTTYAPGVYVGSRAGECVLLKKAPPQAAGEEQLSSYANAFVNRRMMPYFVLPEAFHIFWCILWVGIAAGFTRMPVAISLVLGRRAFRNLAGYLSLDLRMPIIFAVVVAGLILGYIATFLMVLIIDIVSKWFFMGLRRNGQYAWDKDTYCQRWQLYLSIAVVRHFMPGGNDVLEFFLGTQYLVWYFRALGSSIGSNVCLYPNSADPMMTEPELVRIEDGACIDDGMLIAHLNTKGVFSLGPLQIGKHCVLRSWGRLQQGGVMQEGSMLAEHTLVMPGEVVQSHMMKQGWPANTGKRMRTRSAFPSTFSALHEPSLTHGHGPAMPAPPPSAVPHHALPLPTSGAAWTPGGAASARPSVELTSLAGRH